MGATEPTEPRTYGVAMAELERLDVEEPEGGTFHRPDGCLASTVDGGDIPWMGETYPEAKSNCALW